MKPTRAGMRTRAKPALIAITSTINAPTSRTTNGNATAKSSMTGPIPMATGRRHLTAHGYYRKAGDETGILVGCQP